MGTEAFVNGRIYFAQVDLSGHTNQGSLNLEASELDYSSIKDPWDRTKCGRNRLMLDANGFWEAGDANSDAVGLAMLGAPNKVMTFSPNGADGNDALIARGVPLKCTFGAPSGELLTYALSAKGDIGKAVWGNLMHDDTVARTASGNGTARELGALSSTQSMYAALHVISASGTTPTLDVKIQSDTVGFGSATDRITFAQATGATSAWGSVAGAVTDTYWRVNYTISGTDPSFTFVVALGIATT